MTDCIHNHSRWGTNDRIGAGNLLTAQRIEIQITQCAAIRAHGVR